MVNRTKKFKNNRNPSKYKHMAKTKIEYYVTVLPSNKKRWKVTSGTKGNQVTRSYHNKKRVAVEEAKKIAKKHKPAMLGVKLKKGSYSYHRKYT